MSAPLLPRARVRRRARRVARLSPPPLDKHAAPAPVTPARGSSSPRRCADQGLVERRAPTCRIAELARRAGKAMAARVVEDSRRQRLSRGASARAAPRTPYPGRGAARGQNPLLPTNALVATIPISLPFCWLIGQRSTRRRGGRASTSWISRRLSLLVVAGPEIARGRHAVRSPAAARPAPRSIVGQSDLDERATGLLDRVDDGPPRRAGERGADVGNGLLHSLSPLACHASDGPRAHPPGLASRRPPGGWVAPIRAHVPERGRRRVKVEPWPGWLATSSAPPWRSTICRAMASPSPAPPLARAASTR